MMNTKKKRENHDYQRHSCLKIPIIIQIENKQISFDGKSSAIV